MTLTLAAEQVGRGDVGLAWLMMRIGFRPYLSLSFPKIGLEKSWLRLNRLEIRPIWNAFRPSDSPSKGSIGITMLKPNTSVKIMMNMIKRDFFIIRFTELIIIFNLKNT